MVFRDKVNNRPGARFRLPRPATAHYNHPNLELPARPSRPFGHRPATNGPHAAGRRRALSDEYDRPVACPASYLSGAPGRAVRPVPDGDVRAVQLLRDARPADAVHGELLPLGAAVGLDHLQVVL